MHLTAKVKSSPALHPIPIPDLKLQKKDAVLKNRISMI
jgi:hypothetical protein